MKLGSLSLTQELDRIFDRDPGLDGIVVDAPKASDWLERYERAWLKALISMHGVQAVADAYCVYAGDRARSRPERIQAWEDLEPDSRIWWNRDRHGFTCHCCGGAQWRVLVCGAPFCAECAQGEGIDPDGAVPVWRAAAHSLIAYPGLHLGEEPPPPSQFSARFPSGERTFLAGEATPLVATSHGIIPGLDLTTALVEEGTSIFRMEGTADFATALSASFAYSEKGYVLERGVVSAPGMDAVETADIYELVDVTLKASLPAEEVGR